ncbi:MAG: ABC transporter permease subunit [Alphaproteobacteria bacterium]|nr:ABC transporter permease subunit [Alphaproteobacteria bacterium]
MAEIGWYADSLLLGPSARKADIRRLTNSGPIGALIFVSAVGMGPFAGALAIAVSDVMVFSKLFAEAIENVERKQIEGVRSAGAGDVQTLPLAVFPQVFPIMLSHLLYFFERNVRSATILGIVGTGGIGLQLSDRIRIGNWDQAAFIILMILVAVAVIDNLSLRIRLKLIGTASEER